MGSYLVVFVLAALFSATFMPLAIALGGKLGALDDTREPPVPRVGGWAIGFGTATALLLMGYVFAPTGATLLATSQSLGPVSLGALAILIAGTIDDIHPVKARYKLGAQLLISGVMVALGVRIDVVSAPLGPLELGPVVGSVLTLVWFVGITNAFNLLDGADGVAAGAAFFSATAIFVMSVALGHPAIGLVAAGTAGALLGFVPFNFPPARAFLGDSGSMVVGFLLAGLAVEGSTKGPTLVAIAVPLVAFAVPVFDTVMTIVGRVVRGQSVFERDREHLHHRLQRLGLTPRQVAGVIYGASAVFALIAMLFINPVGRSSAVMLIVIGLAVWVVVRYLRLHEINELARVAKRGVLQPRSVAMNVQLRRAADRLEQVESLDDLQAALAILFVGSEFDQVIFMVAPATERRGNTRVWHLEHNRFVEGYPQRPSDEWEVVCPFSGEDWVGELRLRRRLGRRSLLLDLNLLMEIVQPSLERAAARIGHPAALTV